LAHTYNFLYAAAPVGDVLSKDVMDGLAREYRAYANENPTHAAATVAIKILTSVIERSKATTMMGLEKEIKESAAALRRRNPYSIPLEAGCELFLRSVLMFVEISSHAHTMSPMPVYTVPNVCD
jgi:translation initiation factor 2B subunit (eIF-2B alpha/beta/delta family)